MKKSSSSSTARPHISTSLFLRSSKIDSTWSCCRHIDHFTTPSSKPIAAWRVRSNNIWCFLTFQLKFSILKTCERRLVSISSRDEPTCCFVLGTTHFSKLHNRNVQTDARVFIGISLSLSIEKSFAIKSHYIHVNKYIVIVNEHFIIWMWLYNTIS